MKTIILHAILTIHGHQIDLVREMPNLPICQTAMEQLSNFDYQELTCSEQEFE